MLHQNGSKGNEESAFLRLGLSHEVRKLSIMFSLKSLLSLVKIEVFKGLRIVAILGPSLAYYCQSLPFSQ